jgi:MarR family transcriptional regulator for hemolysin
MGITGATLTHHLNMLENRGLVHRWRDPGNRRVQNVELTEAGIELFDRLRVVAVAHDQRLRSGLSDEDVARLGELLDKLEVGVKDADPADAPG